MSDNNVSIPSDAKIVDVFAIKKSEINGVEAFVGFKRPNGDFHYVQVPFTDPEALKILFPKE